MLFPWYQYNMILLFIFPWKECFFSPDIRLRLFERDCNLFLGYMNFSSLLMLISLVILIVLLWPCVVQPDIIRFMTLKSYCLLTCVDVYYVSVYVSKSFFRLKIVLLVFGNLMLHLTECDWKPRDSLYCILIGVWFFFCYNI